MEHIQWLSVLDAALVGIVLWGAVAWLRRTGAGAILFVLAASAALFLLARTFDLPLTGWLLQGVFAVAVLALVVVLQPDLRRLITQLGAVLQRKRPASTASTKSILLEAVAALAHERVGALIVFPGKEPLEGHLSGGESLDAEPSTSLFLSLFDAHSPGHDGAVIVTGDRVARFGAHLPLSEDHAALGPGGTRHAAGLGLAERCDALCVIVSEERGTVSIARDGELRVLDSVKELGPELDGFAFGTRAPGPPVGRRLMRIGLDVGIAAVITSALWLFLTPGSAETEVERTVTVQLENIPEGYAVDAIEPETVELLLSGPRSVLLLEEADAISVTLDAAPIALGRRTFRVRPDDVQHSPHVSVLRIAPRSVRLVVSRR